MLFCEKILYLYPIKQINEIVGFFFPCSQGQGDWGHQNFCFSFKNVCHLVIHKGFTGPMKQKFRQLPRSLTQESIEACCRVEEWLASMFGFSVFIAQILQIVVCLCGSLSLCDIGRRQYPNPNYRSQIHYHCHQSLSFSLKTF